MFPIFVRQVEGDVVLRLFPLQVDVEAHYKQELSKSAPGQYEVKLHESQNGYYLLNTLTQERYDAVGLVAPKRYSIPDYTATMSTDDFFGEARLVVEASSFEHQALWKEFADKISWKQVLHGTIPTVGHLEGKPVSVSIQFAVLEGHGVLFWHPTSVMVNYELIEAWLRDSVKKFQGENHDAVFTDANNFRGEFSRLVGSQETAAVAA